MAVEGIGSGIQNLADQVYGQAQNAPVAAPAAAVNAGNAPVAEDTFTPSSQNNSAQSAAQEAGIFQVTPGVPTVATTNLVIGQASPNANPNGPPAPTVPAAGINGDAPQAAAGTNPNAQAGASQQAAGFPGAPRAANTAAASPSLQVKLQALNAALPALGLTNQQIQQIDRIATLVQDFNPGAYINLVNQFEAQAQASSQQAPAPVAVPPNSAALVNVAEDQNNRGSQAQGIATKTSGSPTNANPGAGNGGAQGAATDSHQTAAASGQPAPAQTPPQNSASGNGNPQTS
jgi:hypothetical protein